MNLIIAFILMAHVGAYWIWYPIVFACWIAHLCYHSHVIKIKNMTEKWK